MIMKENLKRVKIIQLPTLLKINKMNYNHLN